MRALPSAYFTKLSADIDDLYKPCCGHANEGYKLAGEDELATELANMVKALWTRKGMPKGGIDTAMVEQFANHLFSGVTEGYGGVAVDYTTPDINMLESLKKNVFHFSSAKNKTQLKALSKALIGDDGKLRSWPQFKEAASGINNKFVNQWLKTEYNFAVASGQMASKWVDIQASKSTLGVLEFDAVMDKRTTDLCGSLNGITKNADDAFWNVWYPPNHFGCRSTVRQRNSGYKTTPDNKISTPKIPKMFQTNLAKEGLAFPPGHAYYND